MNLRYLLEGALITGGSEHTTFTSGYVGLYEIRGQYNLIKPVNCHKKRYAWKISGLPCATPKIREHAALMAAGNIGFENSNYP